MAIGDLDAIKINRSRLISASLSASNVNNYAIGVGAKGRRRHAANRVEARAFQFSRSFVYLFGCVGSDQRPHAPIIVYKIPTPFAIQYASCKTITQRNLEGSILSPAIFPVLSAAVIVIKKYGVLNLYIVSSRSPRSIQFRGFVGPLSSAPFLTLVGFINPSFRSDTSRLVFLLKNFLLSSLQEVSLYLERGWKQNGVVSWYKYTSTPVRGTNVGLRISDYRWRWAKRWCSFKSAN